MRRVGLRVMKKRVMKIQFLMNRSLCRHHHASSHQDIKNKSHTIISKDHQKTLRKKRASLQHHLSRKTLFINKTLYRHPPSLRRKRSRHIQKYCHLNFLWGWTTRAIWVKLRERIRIKTFLCSWRKKRVLRWWIWLRWRQREGISLSWRRRSQNRKKRWKCNKKK